jgi:hypothetical protein
MTAPIIHDLARARDGGSFSKYERSSSPGTTGNWASCSAMNPTPIPDSVIPVFCAQSPRASTIRRRQT